MTNNGYKQIQVDPEVYEAIKRLAQEKHWTIKYTIEYAIDHIDELPRPDAEAAHVPVVYIAKGAQHE
jgi:predicted transcriptional regulator